MKKFMSLLLIAIMSLSLLCACASDNRTTTQDSFEPTDTGKPEVTSSEPVEKKLGNCSVNVDYGDSVTDPDFCIEAPAGDYEYTYLIISEDATSKAVASVGIPCEELDFDDMLSTRILYQDDEYLLFEVSMYECSYLVSMDKTDLSFSNLPCGIFDVCGDKVIYTTLVYGIPEYMDIIVYDFGLNKVCTLANNEFIACMGSNGSAYYYAVVSSDFDYDSPVDYQIFKYSTSSSKTETVASGTDVFDAVVDVFNKFCPT